MKEPDLLADAGYPALRDWVIERTGLAYYSDKDGDFAARLAHCLAGREQRDCAAYLRLLQHSQREMDALVSELTIGETYFFRQKDHFEALKRVILPDLLERNRDSRRLRIWSAGCATGAEAYSVALLLQLEMPEQLIGWDVSILATDINRTFLARAREGHFDRWALRDMSEDLKARCFRREGKHWVLLPPHREPVTFQYHNLVSDPLPFGGLSAVDLILCRNVMIYFSPETARATAGRLFDCLAEGGWLLVGHAEPNAETFQAFRTVSENGITLYQKAGAEPVAARPFEAVVPVAPPGGPGTGPQTESPAAARKRRPTKLKTRPAAPTVEEARQLADRGQWEAAVAVCRKLLAADPLNAAAHFILALVSEQAGAGEQAERSLRRAIYLDRGFILAHYHLGLVLQKRQAGREARRAFDNVLELLARRSPSEGIEGGDGLTAADLEQSARLHLDLLEGA